MRKKSLGVIALAGILVVGFGLFGFLGGDDPSPPTDASPEEFQGDTFTGEVTGEVPLGTYLGVIVYDRTCSPVGDGLVGCDAGVETQEVGSINFYYEHNMQERPCLVPDQEVMLDVKDEGAIVQRKR